MPAALTAQSLAHADVCHLRISAGAVHPLVQRHAAGAGRCRKRCAGRHAVPVRPRGPPVLPGGRDGRWGSRGASRECGLCSCQLNVHAVGACRLFGWQWLSMPWGMHESHSVLAFVEQGSSGFSIRPCAMSWPLSIEGYGAPHCACVDAECRLQSARRCLMSRLYVRSRWGCRGDMEGEAP